MSECDLGFRLEYERLGNGISQVLINGFSPTVVSREYKRAYVMKSGEFLETSWNELQADFGALAWNIRTIVSNLKTTELKWKYINDNDVVMSEFLSSFDDLTKSEVEELLEWSGDDEYVTADDVLNR